MPELQRFYGMPPCFWRSILRRFFGFPPVLRGSGIYGQVLGDKNARMDFAQLLGARAQFLQWRRHRAAVLAIVERFSPSKHPLRVAVCNALYGDPLVCCTLQADDASCRVCDQIGEEQFRRHSGGLPCTQLFYGSKGPVEMAELPPDLLQSQWLRLEDVVAIIELGYCAAGFTSSVRTLTCLPRVRAKIDGCEERFFASWSIALATLQHVKIDLSGAFAIAITLRRIGLPADISRQILELVVPWPNFVGGGLAPTKKRRRGH